MKHLKSVGFVALAATVVMALVGANSASASVLWQHTGSGDVTLPVGTVIDVSSTPSSSEIVKSTSGIVLDTCTASTKRGKVAGNSTPAAKVKAEAFEFSGCTEPTETSVLGEMEVSNVSGTTNGTLTLKFFTVKITPTVFGAVCEYTAGEKTHLGTLIAAPSATGHATIEVNTVLQAKNSFFCPDAQWQGDWKVTSPTGLYVEP